jgi:23S rRNA A2030 N6-methylase RlmJ
MPPKHTLDQLFTLREASEILNRTVYCIWYHAKQNKSIRPISKGRNLYLTKAHLFVILNEHLRLKKGETRENIHQKIATAISS